MRYKNRQNPILKAISAALLLSFIANSACYGLATLPASQNPLIKREILAALERTNIRYAESRDALRLLEANNASCLLLSSGKYLVTKEVAENGLGLLRAITHEDIEAIMQIMAREDRYKYQGIKELILKYFPPGEESDLPVELYVNHMVAKAFEWLALVENGVIFRNEVREGEEDFVGRAEKIINDNRHNYFTREFWDSAYRRDRIRDAVSRGMRFYLVANPDKDTEEARNPQDLYKYGHLKQLIKEVTEILKNEQKNGLLAEKISGINSSSPGFTEGRIAYIPDKEGALIVIGDTHGDSISTKQILRQERFEERVQGGEKLHIVFLGDYIDEGKNSLDNLETILELKKKYPHLVSILVGNHEYIDQNYEKSEAYKISHPKFKRENWIIDSAPKDFLESFRRFVDNLPVMAVTRNGIVLVHSGAPLLQSEENKKRCANGLLSIRDNAELPREIFTVLIDSKEPRNSEDDKQPGGSATGYDRYKTWSGRISFERFMDSIGGKIMVRGHDSHAGRNITLFDDRFITVISTGRNSAEAAHDYAEICPRYGVFDFAKDYKKIEPNECIFDINQNYRIYPGHARAIERILRSIKENGILEGKKARKAHGIGSSDNFVDDAVATVMVNPALTGQRYVFERPVETDTDGYVDITATDIFPIGPWLASPAMMGDRRVELLFSRTKGKKELIEGLKNAPVEALEKMWLEQILYSYGIGLLGIAQEGRSSTSEYASRMGSAFNIVFVLRFKEMEGRVIRINERMSIHLNPIYAAGEVDLRDGVPETMIRYILVPEHLARFAKDAAFGGEVIEVPMIIRNGLNVPDYENALKELVKKENAPLLAHVARLPTPAEAIDDELERIEKSDDRTSREALIRTMNDGVLRAAMALAGIGDTRAIGPLAVALTSGDRTREELAAETLAAMATPGAREVLQRVLKDTDVKKKLWRYYSIALALVKSGDLEAMPYLEKAISDIGIPFILRAEAIELIVKGIRSENGKFFKGSLIRIIETISPFSMDEIVKALYEEDAAEAKSILFGEMQKVEGERLAALAIAIAEKTGDRDVVPYLERALQENEISHSLRMGRDSIEHALSLFSKNTPSSGEKTDLRTELSDQMRDMYDAGEFKILWLDLLDGSLEEGTVYKIKYDMSRLSDSQIAIIEEYASLLNKKTKSRFETIGCSSAKGSKESLISVYRQDKAGNVKGKGRVDIAIPERDSIDGYMLRIAGMLNIAVAESNIEDNISSEAKTPLLGFIRRQCQLIVSDSAAVPEDPAELIKFIHNIPLPKIYRMPTEKIEEYNRLAKAALIAA